MRKRPLSPFSTVSLGSCNREPDVIPAATANLDAECHEIVTTGGGFGRSREEWLRAWDSRVDQAEEHDYGKQAGFYVDFDVADGKVRVPAELFTELQSTQLVTMVASVVEPAMARTPDDPEQLVTTSPLLHALQEEIEAMRNPSPEEAAAAARALGAKYFGLDEEFLVPDGGENG